MSYEEHPAEGREEIRPQPINMENVMALVARLAQILALEVDHLNRMEVSEIEPLQNEKKWLTKAIELQLKRVQKFPHLMAEITEEEREDFMELIGVFNEIKAENHRRLVAAKEVNSRIVEAIKDVVNEHNRKDKYDAKGLQEQASDSVSITLNEKV
jgi:hypothetical protein